MRRRSAGPILEESLRFGLPTLSRRAAFLISLWVLERSPDPTMREAAAYSLGLGFNDRRAVRPLIRVLRNGAVSSRVRGQAAESLGYALSGRGRRDRPYRMAVCALIGALGDDSPEVRFWAAFALGTIRARAALNELIRVAWTDQALYPGWWRVRDEASDAVTRILGGKPPERRCAGLSDTR